ncbi:MAG: alpha/beta fold hydrolase [Huintestinicola sp.]
MNYIMTEDTFTGSDGITDIHYYIYTPKPELGAPKAVVQICHGMCENIGNYEEFIDELVCSGYAVIGNDCLGHGKTAASDDELGFFALKYGWIYLVKDARRVTLCAREHFGRLPVFLLGHSMGSLVARAYLSRYSTDISGTVLLGTVAKHLPADMGIILADAEIYLFGEKYRSKRISRILYDLGNMKISDRHTDMDWISRDEKAVAKYISDKKCSFIFTSSAYRDVFMLLSFCKSPKWYKSVRSDIPVFIMGGTDDPVCTYGKGAVQLFSDLNRHGFTDTEVKICDGCRHELLHEINRSEIFCDIIHWLDSKYEMTIKKSDKK